MGNLGKVCSGAWGLNIAAACAIHLHGLGHGLSVLAFFAATFFISAAPLHVLLGLSSWAAFLGERAAGEAGAARRAVLRLFFTESVLFWGGYWAMVAGLLPLTIRP